MIDLKKQYDAWQPALQFNKFNFIINKSSNVYLNDAYEQKISELNELVYRLRSEIDILTINKSFDRDSYNAQVKIQRDLEKQIKELKEDVEDKKRELIGERDKYKNRSLADKIKTVFGYE